MKKLFILFAVILLLSSCSDRRNTAEYDRSENPVPDMENMEEYYASLKPIIQRYDGDAFAMGDVTLGGVYTGFERLGKDIIYCNDDNSVIWFDKKDNFSNGIMRLISYNNKVEKLCVFEECRNNIDEICHHMPGNLLTCYSNGFLYTASFDNKGSYILRYDIWGNIIEKLIVFENHIITDMNIHGKYMYVTTCDMEIGSEYNVIRIDIDEESVVLIKSGRGNPLNINDVYFWRDRIILDKYIYDMEFQKSNVFFELEDNLTIIRSSLYMYNGDFYFLCANIGDNYNSRSLYRYNSKKKDKLEILLDGVYEIFINGDFLYYTLYEPYEAYRYNTTACDEDGDEFLSGDIVSETLNNGNKIYRVRLDFEYINFYNAFEIYKPETGYYIYEWKIQNDYVYATLLKEGDLEYIKYYINLVRIKLNSNSPSHTFYESEERWFLRSKKIKDR